MFANPLEVVNRLDSERNAARTLVNEVVRKERGLKIEPLSTTKKFGVLHVVEELKPVIALATSVDGAPSTARTFGVSETTANRYKKENEDGLEKELEPVRRLAIEKLSAAIIRIDDEKLQDVGALNLSNIARNLSTVVGNMGNKDKNGGGSQYSLHIHAPVVANLSQYDIQDV